VVAGFAGEPNALTVADLDGLDAEVTRRGGLASLSDADLLDVITRLRGDRPRVATTILHHPESLETPAPEPVALSFAAQRATPDAVVLSRVSYDRLAVRRMMLPRPLDAAYGALGNDQALALLGPELAALRLRDRARGRPRAGRRARAAATGKEACTPRWLAALRALSPSDALDAPRHPAPRDDHRSVGRAPAQHAARRVERGSPRHRALHRPVVQRRPRVLVPRGLRRALPRLLGRPPPLGRPRARGRGAGPLRHRREADAVGALARPRRRGRHAPGGDGRPRARGAELSADQLAYLNAALQTHEQNVVCTSITVVDGGWYYDLFEPRLELGDRRAMVADVHTQPADESGTTVGRVLHIGTGLPRQMVVIAGPAGRERAYVGLASSYLERVTEGFDRLTDQRWRREASQASAPSWLREISGAPR
jgi:hypothetical protein